MAQRQSADARRHRERAMLSRRGSGHKTVLRPGLNPILAGAHRAGSVIIKFNHPRQFNKVDPTVTVGIGAMHRRGTNYQRIGFR
jgi:hypothetical protein